MDAKAWILNVESDVRVMKTSYKATVVQDPNKVPDPAWRGFPPRTFQHEELELVEHWEAHVRMDNPDAIVEIIRVIEEPVDTA